MLVAGDRVRVDRIFSQGRIGCAFVLHRLRSWGIPGFRHHGQGRCGLGGGGAVFGLFFLTRFSFLQLDQALPVGDGDLVVIRMNFAECQKAVAIATVFHKSRLQAGFDPHHFGQVYVAFKLAFAGGFYIVFVKPIAVQHHNAGLFRVGAVDQHTFGHAGGGSVGPPSRAFCAAPRCYSGGG